MTDEVPQAVFQMGEYMDADETLRVVREARVGLMNLQMRHGMMTTQEDFNMFNTNLAELSKDAHKEKQLKQDESSAEAMMAMAKAASEELARKMGIGLFTQQTAIDVTPPDHNATLREIEGMGVVAEGELYVGTDVRSFDEFQGTVGAELDRRRRGEDEPAVESKDTTDSP